ncbi:Peptidase inhibitor family I36 [Micromonospora rhizosphaerae]|uniref:Peptidase inhibitor family I36 n=2 Tax=Micromonospora rhizosphaerae TaxID=568872 RepID=A0A1C6R883_9ACTN|nr:Peptidase inhibitor family I36 [Micromonospora rhizosphaerae]
MLKRVLARALVTAAVAACGLNATASPAMAVGGCPSGKLCLYEGANFWWLKVYSGSTSACVYYWRNFSLEAIDSYVNYLPVSVRVYSRRDTYTYWYDGTISSGGFSSNTGGSFGYRGVTCTGNAKPDGVVYYR